MSTSSSDTLVAAAPAPSLEIPNGATVSVKIIDTTSTIELPLENIMGPYVPGHDSLVCPAYSFLVEHPNGRKLLYDLGTRKQLDSLSPATREMIDVPGWAFTIEKDTAEILVENGVSLESIEAVVWSHWHFDHTGDMRTFPASVDLIVGSGFKVGLLPAYPTNEHSHLLESDWEGRNLVELEFKGDLKIGQFRAIDYFGDGSFYLLDAPGHAVGHTCALARVTKATSDGGKDTFVFMAGDTCHHGGQWRPNQYLPLPREVALKHKSDASRGRTVCPGSLLQDVHRNSSATTGFYEMAPSFPNNYSDAKHSIASMQAFDAAPNVLVIIAHDCAPLEPESGFTFFPNGTLNNWKADKLDERIRWNFLDDFAGAVEKKAKQETELKGGLVYK